MSIRRGLQDFLVATYLESISDIRIGEGDHAYARLALLSETPYSIDNEESPYENRIQFYIRANYKFNPNKPGIFQWQSVDDVFLMVVD